MAKRSRPTLSRKQPASLSTKALANSATGRHGLVICNYGQTLAVEDEAGKRHRCTPRKKIGALVCGDKVIWQATTADEGVVVALQPRQSLLVRPDSHGEVKPIAANVSHLLVVTTLRLHDTAELVTETDDLIDTDLIDRYLVAAELCRLQAVIVINKTDLLSRAALDQAMRILEVYRTIGYLVLFTSAEQRQGIDALIAILKDHTSVFSGPSGVGKSSLVKALLPDREIRVGEVSESTGAGRHTTTLATHYHLPHGGSLIDSPGVRDFGLWHVDPAQIAQGFVEFQHYAQSCRFANCSHLAEPGCAMQLAVEKGNISALRFDSYRRIVASLRS